MVPQTKLRNNRLPQPTESVGIVPAEIIEQRIHIIRGQRVMLDSDLARLYGVATKTLNRAVKRNGERFPRDFMFQLSVEEARVLRFQSGTSRRGRGGARYRPHAFTEQGVAMLSSVLNSERAIMVNLAIMRTFVRIREMLSTHKDLARRLDALESRYDQRFRVVFQAIRKLMEPPAISRRRIGFRN